MPALYQPQIDTALRLIKTKGRAIIFKRPTGGGIDPVTQVNTVTYTQYPAYAAQLPVNLQGYKSSDLAEDLRTRKSVKLICAAKDLPITPQAAEFVIIDDVDWEIRSVDTLAPDGTPIIHTVVALL